MKVSKKPIPQPDDYGLIRTTNGSEIIVDKEDLPLLTQYHWRIRKSFSRWYAMRKEVRNGQEYWIRMHRQLTLCPEGYVVHHKNRRTLDNRKANLVVMSQKDHHALHVSRFPGRLRVDKKQVNNPQS